MKLFAFIIFLITTTPIDICTLPAPADNGSSHNGTSVTASWTAVTSAVSYKVTVLDRDNGDEVIYNDTVNGLSKNVSGTNSSHDYRIIVRAVCSGGEESSNIIVVDVMGV